MAAALAFAGSAHAHVTRLEMAAPKPAFEGRSFGEAGPYELITGTFHGELDPKDPHNRIITDLAVAPRNARGGDVIRKVRA